MLNPFQYLCASARESESAENQSTQKARLKLGRSLSPNSSVPRTTEYFRRKATGPRLVACSQSADSGAFDRQSGEWFDTVPFSPKVCRTDR